jgi:hypothetical protein
MDGKQNAPAGEGEGVEMTKPEWRMRNDSLAAHGDGGHGGRRRQDDGFGGADGFGIGGGDGSAFDGDIDGEVDELAEALVLRGRGAGGEGCGGEDEEGELHGDRCDCWST